VATRRIARGAPAPTSDGATVEAPRTLGRYQLGEVIGSGGMATVYVGTLQGAAGFERKVAIKVIHPHLSGERRFVEMFLDEAKIAARVHHPNVCQVFDFGEERGLYYLAMEHLEGESLGALVRSAEGLSGPAFERYLGVATHVIGGVAEGLFAAHELGIVHRDVSPTNVVVTYDGVAKVVDFGIAKARGRVHQTSVGVVKGNFAYASPEHLRGQPVDRRADVWSLGVVAWEACTRRSLFARDAYAETIRAVELAEIARPSSVEPSLPPALDAVILRALERDPAARFADTRAFAKAFTRAVQDVAETAQVSRWLVEHFDADAPQEEEVATTRLAAPPPSRRIAVWIAAASLAAFASAWVLAGRDDAPVDIRAEANVADATKDSAKSNDAPAPPEPEQTSTPPPVEARAAPPPRAPANKPRRRRAPRGTGELHLVTTGVSSAPVYLDDTLLAWSPMVEKLPAGRHTLEVRPPGRPAKRVRVRVRADASTRVVVNLE
jgi:tRNA A-37 threonylcarbamoyl transferase component Bud32